MKNKLRLYLTLNHRWGKPGGLFHWSLVLAPKDAGSTQTLMRPSESERAADAIQWDIANTIISSQSAALAQLGEPIPWRRRQQRASQLQNTTLVARVLPAKFDKKEMSSVVDRISKALDSVDVVQNDASFTCRTYILRGIQQLLTHGIVRLSVGSVDELEDKVTQFGSAILLKIMQGEEVIERVADTPVLDLRGNRTPF